jgi:hypothetical protein
VPETLTDEERLNRAVKSLRTLLRDKKELNRLFRNQFESNDDELKYAIMDALMDWNTTPPIIAYVTLDVHPAKQLLIQGAALRALQSAGLWHSREMMPSNDGGTSANDHAKASEYQAWMQQWYTDYERKKSDLKTALNIAGALTNQGTPSEYGSWTFVYGFWW